MILQHKCLVTSRGKRQLPHCLLIWVVTMPVLFVYYPFSHHCLARALNLSTTSKRGTPIACEKRHDFKECRPLSAERSGMTWRRGWCQETGRRWSRDPFLGTDTLIFAPSLWALLSFRRIWWSLTSSVLNFLQDFAKIRIFDVQKLIRKLE